jgi:DNA-binding response OmpR family regulator
VTLSVRPALLLFHHDGRLLDLLTRLFEARGHAVVLAATVKQALSHFTSDRELHAVVAEWDAVHPGGGEIYRWVLDHQFSLRDRFVFVTDDPPSEFDRVVAGRCLTVGANETMEIVRITTTIAARAGKSPELDVEAQWGKTDQPTLLLADDDPALLQAMTDLLTSAGFAVTAVEGGVAAVAALDRAEYDLVLVDWAMAAGSGAHVFQWIVTFRPWLLERLSFLIESAEDRQATEGPGRPVFWKGADAGEMIVALKRGARR